MKSHRVAALCASSVLALGPAMMLHESGHVLVGWLAGGSPILMTATEVRADFGSLSDAGFVAAGISGSVVNLLLCALGWLVFRRGAASPDLRLAGWFTFAVNGFLATTKMMGEPLMGFGDWITILRPFGASTFLRVLVAMVGAGGIVFFVRTSGTALGALVPSGEPSSRKAEARRIVLIGAAAALVLGLGGAVANPVGTTRGVLLALGAVLGPFVPMMFGTRLASRKPPIISSPAAGGWPWLLAAGAVTALMWFVVGPGVSLSELFHR